MDSREIKKFMDDLDESRLEIMDEAERAAHDKAAAVTERFAAAYDWAEEVEDAWRQYQMALSKPERDALRRDAVKYNALSRLFFSARTPEKLAGYAAKSVDQLLRISAEMDAKMRKAQDGKES